MKDKYGVDSMPETAENVAVDFNIEREAQDLMALNSQLCAVAAIEADLKYTVTGLALEGISRGEGSSGINVSISK